LKSATNFIAEAPFSKGLEVRAINKGHVFHLFASYWVDQCIENMLLVPMISPREIATLDVFMLQKSSCDKFLWERFCERVGTLEDAA
jgi:hypothetical protein